MSKTIEEINEKIKKGIAVVVTAEEMVEIVRKKGPEKASKEIDVVTTGTFGPMCSSSVYLNIGHTKPKIKLGGGKCYLNNVPVYCGFAAVDLMLGATALPDDDPRNSIYPGEFRYGGGHVINELVSGKDIKLTAETYGTDCYPKKTLNTTINIKDINECILFNIRNAYQNYNVAVNTSDRTIYTYMGILKPNLGNANYCSAGQLSPLLKDPFYLVTGIGTKIFLGGGIGYIAWHGTQHNPSVPRTPTGIPKFPSGTIAVIGDLKQMKPEWLVGVSFTGYGVSLMVGIGIPIPVLNEEIAKYTGAGDDEIFTQVVDYSHDYPNSIGNTLAEVSYAQLKTGKIKVGSVEVPTSSLSSYSRAVEIANILKEWIIKGKFLLTEPVAKIPGVESGYKFKPLK